MNFLWIWLKRSWQLVSGKIAKSILISCGAHLAAADGKRKNKFFQKILRPTAIKPYLWRERPLRFKRGRWTHGWLNDYRAVLWTQRKSNQGNRQKIRTLVLYRGNQHIMQSWLKKALWSALQNKCTPMINTKSGDSNGLLICKSIHLIFHTRRSVHSRPAGQRFSAPSLHTWLCRSDRGIPLSERRVSDFQSLPNAHSPPTAGLWCCSQSHHPIPILFISTSRISNGSKIALKLYLPPQTLISYFLYIGTDNAFNVSISSAVMILAAPVSTHLSIHIFAP